MAGSDWSHLVTCNGHLHLTSIFAGGKTYMMTWRLLAELLSLEEYIGSGLAGGGRWEARREHEGTWQKKGKEETEKNSMKRRDQDQSRRGRHRAKKRIERERENESEKERGSRSMSQPKVLINSRREQREEQETKTQDDGY